jgi:hypothetical protein
MSYTGKTGMRKNGTSPRNKGRVGGNNNLSCTGKQLCEKEK